MFFCCREAEYCDLRSGDGFVPLPNMQQPRGLGLKKVWFCSGGFFNVLHRFFFDFGNLVSRCDVWNFWGSRTCRGEYAAAAAVGSEFWVATLGGFFRGGPWVGGLRLVNAVLTQSWTHPENVPQVMGGGENCRSSTVEIWDEQGQWRPGPEMRPEDIMNLLWRVMYLQI